MDNSGLIYYFDESEVKHEFLVLSKSMSFQELVEAFAYEHRFVDRALLEDELYVKDLLISWLKNRTDVTITYIREVNDLSMGLLVKRIIGSDERVN